jgi:hypothetical protein
MKKAQPTITKMIRLPAPLAEAAQQRVEEQRTNFNAYVITLISRDLVAVPLEDEQS